MIDADPQCNLTGLVLGFGRSDDIDSFYRDHPDQNIYSGLSPAFQSLPHEIRAIESIQVNSIDNLFLVPGHVNLSEYEITLGIAQELSGSIQALKNLPGSLKFFIDKVAESKNADIVLIDMNPSLSAINQNLLMISDYFIIPTAPDYFSAMAIDSLANILPRWITWAQRASSLEILKSSAYPYPEPRLKLLGTIVQKYRPRQGKPSEGFQVWITELSQRTIRNLIPMCEKYNLLLGKEKYELLGEGFMNSFCLSEIPDFNTLIATSQTYKVPVFALKDEMMGHQGAVLEQDIKKREEFDKIFTDLVEKILVLI